MTAVRRYRLISLAVGLVMALANLVAWAAAPVPIQQLTDDAGSDLRPAWSPDGQLVAFQSNRQGRYQIYLMRPDGADERLLSPSGSADDRHPAWRPDGKVIAIDSGKEGRREIWTVDVASGTRTQLTSLGAVASFPSWNPDGSRLGFYLYRAGSMELWAIGADGVGARQLTYQLASELNGQCTFACHAIGWSPDGRRIAYTNGDQDQVWTMRASDGGDPIKVSRDIPGGRSHFPSYLPDGRLVYTTEHVMPGRSWTDVWVVQPDGSTPPERLLEGVQAQGPFAFRPDGQSLLLASPRSGNFDLYTVPLGAEGQAALRDRSAPSERAPGLAARREGGGSVAPTAAATPATDAAVPPSSQTPDWSWTSVVGLGVAAALGVLGAIGHRLTRGRRDGRP